MPVITLENVPALLYEELKQSAARNKRSINNEIIYHLKHDRTRKTIEPTTLISKITELQTQLSLPALNDEILEEAKQTGRP